MGTVVQVIACSWMLNQWGKKGLQSNSLCTLKLHISGRSRFYPEERSLLTGTEVPNGLAMVLDGRMKRRQRRGVEVRKTPSTSNLSALHLARSSTVSPGKHSSPQLLFYSSMPAYLYSKSQSLPSPGSLPNCPHHPKGAPGSC